MAGEYGPDRELPGKGDTRCNRFACQTPLDDSRMWNTVTRAWYCRYCGTRINESADICITLAQYHALPNT